MSLRLLGPLLPVLRRGLVSLFGATSDLPAVAYASTGTATRRPRSGPRPLPLSGLLRPHRDDVGLLLVRHLFDAIDGASAEAVVAHLGADAAAARPTLPSQQQSFAGG